MVEKQEDLGMSLEKKNNEKQLWNIVQQLRTEIPAAEYKKVIIAIVAASRLAKENEWQEMLEAKKSETVAEMMENLFIRYDLSGLLPPELSKLPRSTLDEVMKKCASFEGSFADAYEYCLRTFAEHDGKNNGEFYTPFKIHKLIRLMLRPRSGESVYDPCCGAGLAFLRMGQGVKMYGQEKNTTAWLMAKAAAIAQGIDTAVGSVPEDTLRKDLHEGEFYDYAISNPPFNKKMTLPIPDDERWMCGKPEGATENYAWLEQMLYHLKETGQMACILTISSLTSSNKSDRAIRKAFVEGGYVDAAIILPRGLFYATTIPVCLWIMSRKKTDRILFVNSYDVFNEERISKIASVWHQFEAGETPEQPHFCRCASIREIRQKDYDLSPNSYISFFSNEKREGVRYISLAAACVIRRGNAKSGGSLYPLYGSSNIYEKTDMQCPVHETVLIGRKGTIGNPRYVSGDFGVSDTSYYIKSVIDPNLDLRYLCAYLQTVDFSVFNNGSGTPSLSKNAFSSIIIPVPDRSFQISVAEAVEGLNDSQQILAKSADAAAKLIISLYRKSFTPSASSFRSLKEFCHIKKGRTPSGEGQVPYVNASVLCHPVVSNYAGFCHEVDPAPKGSLFVSYKLSMGRVSFSPVECAWNEGLAMLDAPLKVRLYLFGFLSTFQWDSLPSTSCLGRAINLPILGSIQVPVPKSDQLDQFYSQAYPVWLSMISSAAEACRIRSQRLNIINSIFKADL